MTTSLSFTHFLSLPRWHSNWPFYPSLNLGQVQDFRLEHKWVVRAMSRKKVPEPLVQEAVIEEEVVVKKPTVKRGRKKTVVTSKILEETSEVPMSNDDDTHTIEEIVTEKTPRRTRKKAASTATGVDEEKVEKKKRGRKPKKKVVDTEDLVRESELSDHESSSHITSVEEGMEPNMEEGEDEEKVEKKKRGRKPKKKVVDTEDLVSESELSDQESSSQITSVEEDMEPNIDEGEDISFLYGWPPLVCCFGAAQHAFVPSGKPANRLINHQIHERMKDAFWVPEKFVRAPGGSAGSVAIALASLGGKVALMGKLGDDAYGQAMLYYLNVNNVQTRSVRVDSKRATAIAQMKISKRGGLKMTCVKPSAEDYLSKSEINIDVLKEAKMFYFNTSSLLERNMRSTAFQAIKMSKKLGSVIFFDLNLPLPLWESSEETKTFIQQAWNSANIIEVTKQELEFLCGIIPTEKFDTKNNDKSKFVHYGPEVIQQLWHENLKVLFVTNGTSKVHYYTEEHNGAVNGMEDAPITPFTAEMSASGDGIVAGLMRMLTVQPDLITDKGYLEHLIKYAIDCGVIDQWILGRTRGFPPDEEADVEEDILPDLNGIKSLTEKEYRTLASVD